MNENEHVDVVMAAQDTVGVGDAPQEKTNKLLTAMKKHRKKLLILVPAVVAVVALCVLLGSRSPESVAERYAKAYLTDQKTVAKLKAYDYQKYLCYSYDGDEEAFFEAYSDLLDEDISGWNEYYKVCDASRKEDLEEAYGEFKVTAETTRTKDISVKKLDEDRSWWLDWLEKHCEPFDRDDIQDAKIVTVKLKIKGEDDSDRESMEVYLVKIHGSWRVLD